MLHERNPKYFSTYTNNKVGRDMIKTAYILHRGRVSRVKSVVDTSPPRSYIKKPAALSRHTEKSKTHLILFFNHFVGGSNFDSICLRTPKPKSISQTSPSSSYRSPRNDFSAKFFSTFENSSIDLDNRFSTALKCISSSNITHNARASSTPHFRQYPVKDIMGQYLTEDRSPKAARKMSSIDGYRTGLPNRFEEIVNNTPRIRHDMPQEHIHIYDEFVKMLVHYNEKQIADILQGVQTAAADLKLLSQFGSAEEENWKESEQNYKSDNNAENEQPSSLTFEQSSSL